MPNKQKVLRWLQTLHYLIDIPVSFQRAVIIAELQNSSFISVYPDSYNYDKLFFGETDKKFILVNLQLIE